MTSILSLDDVAARKSDVAGGKGAALARLMASSYAVPRGFVVTADAYRRWLQPMDHALHQSIEARAELEALPLPSDLESELRAWLDRIEAPYGFAVRSSATAEDSASAAFAGIYESFIGADSAERVLADVKAVFLSYWSDRALAYRERHGIDHLSGAMAVVVQRLVPADAAGVAFSIDPVSGDADRLVLTANYGLGESVVSGESEIDRFVIGKTSGALVERVIGYKTVRTVLQGDRACVAAVADDAAHRPCITDAQALAVAQLCKELETRFAAPQDVEWAFCEGALHVLQARPITRIPPRWTRDESAERFPDPVTPMTWALVDAGFDEALAHSFSLMGLPPLRDKWFAKFDNYIYGNQNAVDRYLGSLSREFSPNAEILGTIAAFERRFGWVGEFPVAWHQELDHYLMRLGALTAKDLAPLSTAEIWRHAGEVAALGRDYFKSNIAISFGQSALFKLLQGVAGFLLGKEQGAIATSAILSMAQTRTNAVNREIAKLADAARAEPELATLLLKQSVRDILRQNALSRFPAFNQAFAALLQRHGHRETSFDPYYPSWGEAPWIALNFVKLALQAPALVPSTKSSKGFAAETAIMQAAPEALRERLRDLIALVVRFTELDDLEHYQTSRLGPVIRRALQALGGKLKDRGLIAEPGDVFFALPAEIDMLVATSDASSRSGFAAAIAQRKQAFELARQRQPDWQVGHAAPATLDQESLIGTPGAPGAIEGEAVVAISIADIGSFPPGAILVTRATTPAWAPFLFVAGGVVCESGGPLSHGAVVARELGVPAVMAVRNVLSTLRTGDRIRIDGTAGTVSRLPALVQST